MTVKDEFSSCLGSEVPNFEKLMFNNDCKKMNFHHA